MDNHGIANEHENWDEQRERLSAYVDGELSVADSQRLERHLPTCAACQRELAELHALRALLHALPAPRLPRSFTLPESEPVPIAAATAQRQREARRRASAVARAIQWMGGVAAAAGLLLVLGSALVGLGGNHSAASTSSGGAAAPASRSITPPDRSPAVSTSAGSTLTGNQTRQTQATPTPQSTASSEHSPYFAKQQHPTAASGGQSGEVPVVPLTGAGLVFAGGALFVGGRVAGRRGRSRGNTN